MFSKQGTRALSMTRYRADPLQHICCFFNQNLDTRREAKIVPCDEHAKAERKASGEGDHDGGIVRHRFQAPLALDGSAHDVKRRGKAGGVEETLYFGWGGGVVDYAAIG